MKKAFACEEPFRTPRQLAVRWRWNVESVRRKIRRGELKCIAVGGRILIPVNEIERVEAEGMVQSRKIIKRIG